METYYGRVRTPHDAIKLFEACRQGILPRVLRRLSEQERRRAIRPGSVFVWDEREAGMRRWTDGMPWSPSRVSGSFLTYRELEGKGRGEKAGGLIKQSFSITTSAGQHLHLISYYHHHARPQADLPLPLPLPTTDPRLKIRPALM
ncbi:Gti1/Pac2 family-domain-containing protein [Diplogelasinospora grovesii]|uniref:Gti1/Pac2 family-domain-containing protein n=1 Tax=Diplogelasinospora grovesii TaxID=303347 RepID=A0AAN6S4J3_9PEZI|nr:Gti1/Pac2 family-domain-containing protein [Diplogelasinospora grovesii]